MGRKLLLRAVGMILALASAASATETTTYTYDAQGRVIATDKAGTVNDGRFVDITYDDAGNRTNYLSADNTLALLSVTDATAGEGGTLSFTVNRAGVTSSAVSVNYASADGTAVAGSDYTAVSGTLNFASGETSKVVTITTLGDVYDESSETLSLDLSSPSVGAVAADPNGAGTINDASAPAVRFEISNESVTEGGNLVFTVTKEGFSLSTITVNYATGDASAVAGSDYTSKTGTLSFTVLDYFKTVSVPTTADSVEEALETMKLTLSSPSGGMGLEGDEYIGVGTINDDDGPALAIADASAAEGSSLSFTVTRSGPTGSAFNVDYTTSDGTATIGNDYTPAAGTLSFASGQTSKTITVPTVNDSIAEASETFSVVLSSPTGTARISDGSATGTITDNDGTPAQFSIGSASATESGSMTFTVTRGGTTSTLASVNYATADVTATAGSDYSAASGTLIFAASDTSETFTVSTINDTAVEAPETFSVNLSGASAGSTITTASNTGTINDNDIGFSISNDRVDEGTAFAFTVTREGSTTGSVSVNYATSNGTATAGSDYTAKSGTLTFASGVATQTIVVNTTNDTAIEDDETITVTLSSPTGGAVLIDPTATGTIESDDFGFQISDESHAESGSFSFTVTRVGAEVASSVSYATSNGTATAGSDYTAKSGTLSFSASATSKTISIPILADTIDEPNETVIVTLSSPSPAPGVLIDATGIGTIVDDD